MLIEGREYAVMAFYHVSLWYEKVDLPQAASRGVRATSKEFVNAALFLRLDLKFVPSTLARHENRTFAKRSRPVAMIT